MYWDDAARGRDSRRVLLFAVFTFLLCFCSVLRAETVNVAVATNFLEPARELGDAFEKETGHSVRLSGGSTGKLYAQIVNGAPFHVFLAANDSEPRRLEESGLAAADSRFTYAIGRLVLWTADDQCVWEVEIARWRDGTARRLAIANPKTAPYGAAAMAVIDSLDLQASLAGKIIRGENVGQTYQFLATGNAENGFVAMSQVVTGKAGGSYCVVARELYPPIIQQAVLLETARNNEAAMQFLSFLKSDHARQIIERAGYATGP